MVGICLMDDAHLSRAVVVALGSNLPGDHGDVQAILARALTDLGSMGLDVVARSSWWMSLAWPNPSDPCFLNGIAIVETALQPEEVLAALHELEARAGRLRSRPNSPRTLDLDLIAYGREIRDEARFQLPHPRAHQRLFVMGPLAEIAPGWVHPTLGQTAEALAHSATIGLDARPAPAGPVRE